MAVTSKYSHAVALAPPPLKAADVTIEVVRTTDGSVLLQERRDAGAAADRLATAWALEAITDAIVATLPTNALDIGQVGVRTRDGSSPQSRRRSVRSSPPKIISGDSDLSSLPSLAVSTDAAGTMPAEFTAATEKGASAGTIAMSDADLDSLFGAGSASAAASAAQASEYDFDMDVAEPTARHRSEHSGVTPAAKAFLDALPDLAYLLG